jgi:hypothetical protein
VPPTFAPGAWLTFSIGRNAIDTLALRLTPRELQRVQEHSLVLIKSAEQRVAGFLLEMERRWVRASSTNAILIQVNVAIGRSAEMAVPEEDVFLGGLYQRVICRATSLSSQQASLLRCA